MRFIFLVLSGLGLVFAIILNTKTADLYPGNAHHTIGWVATTMVAIHALTDILIRSTKWSKRNHSEAGEGARLSFRPSIKKTRQSIYRWLPGIKGQVSRISPDNHGYNILEIRQHCPVGELESSETVKDEEEGEGEDECKSLVSDQRSLLRTNSLHKDFSRRISGPAFSKLLRMCKFLYKVIDWTILVVGYITLVTGGVTYTGIFVSKR